MIGAWLRGFREGCAAILWDLRTNEPVKLVQLIMAAVVLVSMGIVMLLRWSVER